MIIINFDKGELKNIENLYNKALKDNKESFIYNGNQYLTTYAKYLIEYLKSKLN